MRGLDKRVVAIGAARIVGDSLRTYGPTGIDGTREERHRAVEWLVRQALSGVHEGFDIENDYAILDCYDENDDLICDYGIRDRQAFQRLYRKANWHTDT